MRTKQIADIPLTWTPSASEARVTKTFHFELITPMFGGDAESWKLNMKAPVRAQSVKGQLRFWWRTMQTETNAKTLLHKENILWGGAYGGKDDEKHQSQVRIAVVNQNVKHSEMAHMESNYACDGRIIPKYVLFPITDKVKKDDEIHLITELSFDLQISCPSTQYKEVENTLKLWCLLGGVGARTRRGTGSIYCEELLSFIEDENMLWAFLRQWTHPGEHRPANDHPYPILKNARFFANKNNVGDNAADIWRGMLEGYGNYRQGPGVGRTPNQPKPGRSYWPEPDRIRAITRKSMGKHASPVNDEGWFPRAAFGLPILTKFIDEGRGDPPTTELKPLDYSRWPSPMILKVIKLSNGSVLKIGVVLNHSEPDRIELIWDRNRGNYKLDEKESPLSKILGRKMKSHGQPLLGEDTPYDHLFNFLNLEDRS